MNNYKKILITLSLSILSFSSFAQNKNQQQCDSSCASTNYQLRQIDGFVSKGGTVSLNQLKQDIKQDIKQETNQMVNNAVHANSSTVDITSGIIAYKSHIEQFGIVYQIPDDSCVMVSYHIPMRTILALNVSIVNNTNVSVGEISSAYAMRVDQYTFRICIKNRNFYANQDVEWRAVGVR